MFTGDRYGDRSGKGLARFLGLGFRGLDVREKLVISSLAQELARVEVTLTPGQSFYEGPDDVHLVDRNASTTQPAKFVVVLIKDKGAPALVPVK